MVQTARSACLNFDPELLLISWCVPPRSSSNLTGQYGTQVEVVPYFGHAAHRFVVFFRKRLSREHSADAWGLETVRKDEGVCNLVFVLDSRATRGAAATPVVYCRDGSL